MRLLMTPLLDMPCERFIFLLQARSIFAVRASERSHFVLVRAHQCLV